MNMEAELAEPRAAETTMHGQREAAERQITALKTYLVDGKPAAEKLLGWTL